ncbi:hypothetical protein AC1031_011620 [Aphanomyces cochlioides]|nr:hypothetical protein AC1031_011620 [Aphanomyces cochlioides]
MDWFKKKTKQVQDKVAKIQQDQKLKSQTFSGTGHTLDGSSAAPASKPSMFNRPASAPALTDEERDLRRQQQAEAAAKRGVPQPKKRTTGSSFDADFERDDDRDDTPSEIFEQAKALEQMRIQESGFNPYQATFSSAAEARSASAIVADTSAQPPPPPSRRSPPKPKAAPKVSLPAPTAAILRKMLQNILDNPDEEKFQKLRLSNSAIQSKIVAVPEAVALLHDIGFDPVTMEDGEDYFILNATRTSQETLQLALSSLPS